MAIREYECDTHGYFRVEKSITSTPFEELCPKCYKLAQWCPTTAPIFGMSNIDGGIPNKTQDEKEYEGWQRDTWTKFEDKLNIDNAGTERVPLNKLIKKTESGKHR